MIRNRDGTPYKPSGLVSQFREHSLEYDLFNQWDQESIVRGGQPVFYYECIIQPQTVHPTYLEDKGKLFSPVPVQLWALYEPQPQENFVGEMGFDSPNKEIVLEFNYQYFLNVVGHEPKVGSRIHTPHLKEDWEILNRKLSDFKMWSILRLQVRCRAFQEDLSISEGKVTKNTPSEIRIDL